MKTPWELFRETLEGKWMYLKLPDRKNCSYVKFTGSSHSLESNVRVLRINYNFTVGPNKKHPSEVKDLFWAHDNLSYYKLFKYCSFIKDVELLDKLDKIELKLKLRT